MAKGKQANKQLLERFEYASNQKQKHFEASCNKAYGYYNGTSHWSPAEVTALENEDRLPTKLNYVFKILNTISGNERQNRNDLHIFPMENGDVDISNILNYLFKYVKKNNNLDWLSSDVAMDGFLTNQGWYKNYIKVDDLFKPEIKIKKVSPKLMYFDPDSIDYGLADAQDVFEAVWENKEKLKEQYPNLEKEIEAWSSDKHISERDLYVDEKKDLVRVVDAEYKVYERKPFWFDGSSLSDKPGKGKKIYHTIEKIKFKRFFGDIVLEEMDDPYGCGGFSYTPLFPYFVNGCGVSIFEQIVDVQDIINKSHSQFMDSLNRQLGVGILYEDGAVEDEDVLVDFRNGGIGKLPAGSISGGKIKITDPPEYPAAHAKTVTDAITLMKEIVGITEVFEGFAPGRIESGLGVQILKRQSGLVFEQPTDNIRMTQINLGRKILNQISKFWSTDKVARIVGEDGNYNDITVTNTEIRTSQVDKNTGDTKEVNVLANTLKEGKYDFVIDVNQPSVTARQYNLLLGIEIFKIVPDPRLIALLVDMTDFPHKDEWIATLTQAVEEQGVNPSEGGGQLSELLSQNQGEMGV